MQYKAFTNFGCLWVIMIIALLLALLLPVMNHLRESANRSVSRSCLHSIYTSMHTYSVTQNDWFPIAGEFTEGDITGFKAGSLRGKKEVKRNDPHMINNGTASLWLIVRDGMVNSKSFVNPSTKDKKDGQKDASGKPVALNETWDFLGAKDNKDHKTLSYSFINMYHQERKKNWSANVSSNWVIMGANNDADDSTKGRAMDNIHSMAKQINNKPRDIERLENSTSHEQDGQNFLFGDGHVEFSSDPFIGPSIDNVYAKDTSTDDPDSSTYTEKPAPPTLDCTEEWTQPQRDVMLIPLTGNNGVNLSDSGR